MFPMQQPMTARPGTLYQPAPAQQQQPQVIIVQPAYQTPYAQPQQPAAAHRMSRQRLLLRAGEAVTQLADGLFGLMAEFVST